MQKLLPWKYFPLEDEHLIPFYYKQFNESFMISIVNNGMILCKRLGLQPYKIVLGKEEVKEIQGWAVSHTPLGEKALNHFNLELIKTGKKSELQFVCKIPA